MAFVAQVIVALGPVAEGREGASTAAHVESAGTSTHFAHNDATCAACQARSVHSIAPQMPAVAIARVLVAKGFDAPRYRVVAARLSRKTAPRAPPRVI